MSQVMESQIIDSENMACPGECCSNALWIEWENAWVRPRLALDNVPRFLRVLEATMIALLFSRMLSVANDTGARYIIIVFPFDAADFCLSSRGVDREVQDVSHGQIGPLVSMSEVLVELLEFLGRRTPISFSGPFGQTKLATSRASLLGNLGPNRKLSDALGRPENNADPDKVIGYRGWARAVGPALLYMCDQFGSGEFERTRLADRVLLQEL